MTMPMNYFALTLTVFLGWLISASAQLHTECNPIISSKCPADPALGTTFQWDFRHGPTNAFGTSSGWLPYIRYDSNNGVTMKVNSSGIAPTLTSKFYIMFGRLEVVIKTASGTGIVSDVIFESDDQDEIDLEWVATQPNTVQSNYYSPRGRTPSYNQMKMLTTSSSMQTSFRTYTVDWNLDRLTWAVDGVVMRTVSSKNNDQYPQSPMKITIGLWAGGDSKNSPGTIFWAGGRTDYSKGPFEMSIKSIKVVDYSRGSSYSYGDKSGKYGSIKAENGAIRPHASRAANSATVSTYKVPASLVHSTKIATSTINHTPTAPTTYPLPVSKNGQCGTAANSSTCAGSGFGNCCSQYGYCGSGPEYCGEGCLQYYGLCGSQTLPSSSTKASSVPTNLPVHGVSPGGYCGVKNGSTTCIGSGFGECCSQYGACGNGKDWCGSGCQPSFGNCDGYPKKYPPSQLTTTSSRSPTISWTNTASLTVSKASSATTRASPTAIKTSSASFIASSTTIKASLISSKTFSAMSNAPSATSPLTPTVAQTSSVTARTSSTVAHSSLTIPQISPSTLTTSLTTPMEPSTRIQESSTTSKLSSSVSQASFTPTPSPAFSKSLNGRCGRANGNTTCANSGFGQCCSQYSYCGDTTDYCGAGCQSAFGNCDENASQLPASTSAPTAAQPSDVNSSKVSPGGYCGPDNGSTTCTGSNFGRCCSQYGSCGNTDEYCGNGCQPLFGTCNGQYSSFGPSASIISSSSGASSTPPVSSTWSLTTSPRAYTYSSDSLISSDRTPASIPAYVSTSGPASTSKSFVSTDFIHQTSATISGTSLSVPITSSVSSGLPSNSAEGDEYVYSSSIPIFTPTRTSSMLSVSAALSSSNSLGSTVVSSTSLQLSPSKSVGSTSSSLTAASTSSAASASPSTFTTLDCPHDNGTSYLSPNTMPNRVYNVYCNSDLPPGTIGWGGGKDIFQCIKQCDAKVGCIAVTYAPWFGQGACYYRGNVTTIISRDNATLAILQASKASSKLRKFRRGIFS